MIIDYSALSYRIFFRHNFAFRNRPLYCKRKKVNSLQTYPVDSALKRCANDVETTVSTSFQREIRVVLLVGLYSFPSIFSMGSSSNPKLLYKRFEETSWKYKIG